MAEGHAQTWKEKKETEGGAEIGMLRPQAWEALGVLTDSRTPLGSGLHVVEKMGARIC